MKTKFAYLIRAVAIGVFLAGGTVSIPSNVQAEPPDCTNAEGPWMAEPCYLCSTAEAGWAMGKGSPVPCPPEGGVSDEHLKAKSKLAQGDGSVKPSNSYQVETKSVVVPTASERTNSERIAKK